MNLLNNETTQPSRPDADMSIPEIWIDAYDLGYVSSQFNIY